ncbi:MAG TPA: hypothetical protein VL326_12235 [Kofleriaceae bacterium]|nr:hypothetical protein [Kofleriaceae bacterium]
MDSRLQRAIGTPRVQQQAGELVRLALVALEDLKQIDENLYDRFLSTRNSKLGPEAVAEGLLKLWDDTFRGLEAMLAFARSLSAVQQDAQAAKDKADSAGGDGFDFGDFTEAPSDPSLDIGAGDIGDLLDGLGGAGEEDETAKWNGVLEKVGSIEYGLTSQLKEARERVDKALESGETNQVLSILDDTNSSSSEGVHALVAAVYEAFLPDVNAATVVPGYLTSLGRALLVRRGLADLGQRLTPQNNLLQGDDPTEHKIALEQIKLTMRQFVGSVVCRAMRAADRWQMVQFEGELSEQPLKAARLTSEGLVKYIDSLSSVNQREVLVVHDRRTLEDMRDALSNARQLIDISPRAAREMMDRAYQSAQRLRGRHPATDDLIIQLERYAPTSSNPGEGVKFLERLEAVLAAAP